MANACSRYKNVPDSHEAEKSERCIEDVSLRQAETVAKNAYRVAHNNYLSFLSQKAKVTWIEEGDDNTRLFHQSTKIRGIQNRINAIKNANGEWAETSQGVIGAFLDSYKDMVGSSSDTRKVDNRIIHLGEVLNSDQHQMLDLNFDVREIKLAIFSIPNEKAPAIDGHDVVATIQAFFRTRRLLQESNVTTITIIPKIKCPTGVGDYMPIACCSVIYKAITKLTCSKLGSVLPELISPDQGAFISGRSSSLPSSFHKVHYGCITTPKLTLLIHGSTEGFFHAKKGLRQGDPMSPLLFMIFVDYLTRVLHYIDKLEGRCSLSLSWLQANNAKSTLYCSGIIDDEANRIQQFSSFSREQLPFTYLGVPISKKMISTANCEGLLKRWFAEFVHGLLVPRVVILTGIRCAQWNIVAVGKLVWHIGIKKDDLWVKWIHSIYIKDQNWWSFSAPPNASWIVKQLCKVKSTLRGLNMQNRQQDKKYSIATVYQTIIHQGEVVN
ncbi:uncharacterized protein LOC104884301 [Beta vulgaris subsp. vulgaris]|uniref:uncharacterized protein LOC104884301 n=1 Tax=Beta vulgaris subsp. vulgaris TaxID=3555 RepID=UPI00054012EF|nr:uncharacterized protein LOC104884301 [Beta vulgaris subsp. vulgaris]